MKTQVDTIKDFLSSERHDTQFFSITLSHQSLTYYTVQLIYKLNMEILAAEELTFSIDFLLLTA